jgi:signal transduction histidine kinase
MHPLRTLRGRLIAMVAALLAITIGSIAVISTGVVHYEIRKFEIEDRSGRMLHAAEVLRDFYRAKRSWNGVQPVLDQVARSARSRVVLFDAGQRFIAASPASIRPHLTARNALEVESERPDGKVREMIRGPQVILRDSDGSVAGLLFILPPRALAPPLPQTRSLDRWLFWTFATAAIFGVLMAVAIARWTTVPIERLTDATRRMEAGDLSVRVDPSGGEELAELARGFNAMAAAVDRNEEVRRRMVSDVAHELRAPLTNIRCELESIQDGLVEPTRERFASLHEETMHLARLVEDLQDLALADAGRLEIDSEPIAVDALARRAAAAMEMSACERGVTIVVDGDAAVIVRADRTRAVQIITNLLSNAVTHTQKPGEVRIDWQRNEKEAVIRVIDHGSGIPPEELPRIFDRFYRVDASRSRNTGGAGLGLSIVQQLVAAHGGRVWAESTPGAGSTFSFTLPLSS